MQNVKILRRKTDRRRAMTNTSLESLVQVSKNMKALSLTDHKAMLKIFITQSQANI